MSYSTAVGRFLRRDPIGYVDGPNLCQYELENPLKYLDSMGTTTIDVVPKSNAGMPDAKKDKIKSDGKSDKKTDWPIWWARLYSNAYLTNYTLDTTSVEDMVDQMVNTVGDPSKEGNRIRSVRTAVKVQSKWVKKAAAQTGSLPAISKS